MSGFLRALPFVLDREGGYSNHPLDRGGPTKWGITHRNYDKYRRATGQRMQDVREMTEDECRQIYHRYYWVEAKCDAWPWPVNRAVFDAATQHHPVWAIKLLQRAAGVDDDGIVGPITFDAVTDADPHELVDELIWERLRYYARIVRNDPSQSAFILGWVNRMYELARAA